MSNTSNNETSSSDSPKNEEENGTEPVHLIFLTEADEEICTLDITYDEYQLLLRGAETEGVTIQEHLLGALRKLVEDHE